MSLLTLSEEGTKLRLTLTDAGREALLGYAKLGAKVEWAAPHITILKALLCNSDLELLSDVDAADVGARTSSPLLAFGVERAERYQAATAETGEILEGQLLKVDRVYWFPNYAVESELETLLRQGFVEFDKAAETPAEPQETFTCTNCEKTFTDDTDALDHKCEKASE